MPVEQNILRSWVEGNIAESKAARKAREQALHGNQQHFRSFGQYAIRANIERNIEENREAIEARKKVKDGKYRRYFVLSDYPNSNVEWGIYKNIDMPEGTPFLLRDNPRELQRMKHRLMRIIRNAALGSAIKAEQKR